MPALANFVRSEVWLLLGGLLAIVAYKLLTGGINTANMLADKETGGISPGRVQLLVVTLFTALYYISLASNSPKQLPEIPQEMLLLLSGSHLLYLGGKVSPLLAQFFRQGSNSDN